MKSCARPSGMPMSSSCWTGPFPTAGRGGRSASEVKAAFYSQAKKPKIVSFVGGLGGRDITVSGFKNLIKRGIEIARTGSKNEYEIYGVRE